MENALKGLIMAAGVVITCVIIGLGFYMMREAEATAKAASEDLMELRTELSEAELVQYDGMQVTGAEVLNFIKKTLGAVEKGDIPEIRITIAGSGTSYTYKDNTYFAQLQEKGTARYLNPLSIYVGKLVRDSNGVITEIIFNKK